MTALPVVLACAAQPGAPPQAGTEAPPGSVVDWIDYETHARTRDRDDLWGQVRRTVRGRPLGPEQIDMIVSAILRQLYLAPNDVLLDLACGNGALSARLQPYCAASLGVDISGYLVGVAQDRFATAQHRFLVQDAGNYVDSGPAPGRFTKALCYGSFSYLDDETASRTLRALRARFPSLRRVLLGNLPDPARAAAFLGDAPWPDLQEPRSSIGVWRDLNRVAALAGPGWRVSASVMQPSFFAAHYRFDAVLDRAE